MAAALRRALPLWLVLVAAYAAALAAGAGPVAESSAPEAHRLRTTAAIVADGRIVAPHDLGFELLIAPAYAVAGTTGVQLFLAAVAGLAFCLAAALGRALVPEPWPTRAALVCGLSPPALTAATAIAPGMTAAAVLAGATLLALGVRARPQPRRTFGCAVLVAALPWLAARLVVPAAVVAVALAHWLRRRRRGIAGFIALEVALTSAVVYLTVNDRLSGSPLVRRPRPSLAGLEAAGALVAWAPFLLLALVAVGLLWRSRRDRLADAVPEQADVEGGAALLALVAVAVGAAAVLAAPDAGSYGLLVVPALPALTALAAWGLRFTPRAGAALAAVTLGESAWVLLGG
jgi:hypothetical protein